MTIVLVVGARPNFVKIAPILAQLRQCADVSSMLVHTGQHHDDTLSGSFFRDLDIPPPDVHLGVTSDTPAARLAEMIARLAPIFSAHQADVALVVGDVDSTLAGALAAAKCGIPIAHVEAGLRSFDRTMPEEINRVLTDSTLRTSTERPITTTQGTNEVVGVDPRRIVAAWKRIRRGRWRAGRRPALWDGRAAERIVGVLTSRVGSR